MKGTSIKISLESFNLMRDRIERAEKKVAEYKEALDIVKEQRDEWEKIYGQK